MQLDEICHKLEKTIGKKRLRHSIGVMNTAVDLADKYNYDKEKAKIAGLLHDCGKIEDKPTLLKMADTFGIIQDDVMKNNYQLIHGPLGASIAEKYYKIKDQEILNAIYYHTTGRENMTLLEKIIYISDYIEPGRKLLGLEEIRQTAYTDLDKAMLLSMDQVLKYILSKGELIHMNTVKARNYLINEIKEKAN